MLQHLPFVHPFLNLFYLFEFNDIIINDGQGKVTLTCSMVDHFQNDLGDFLKHNIEIRPVKVKCRSLFLNKLFK